MDQPATDFTQRNQAIDILRALTMLLMIFVNDLVSISGYPEWLGHAKVHQDMLGLADIVFPCFLFAVGMSIPFAIESRFAKGYSGVSTVAHILIRTLALLLMGVFIANSESGVSAESGLSVASYRILMVIAFLLVWNVYPRTINLRNQRIFQGLKYLGLALLLYLAIVYRDPEGGVFQARWWGILGLIGWSYFFCAMTYVFARNRFRYLVPIWLGLLILCILESNLRTGSSILNLPRGNFFDQLLGLIHLGNGSLAAFTMGGILVSLASLRYKEVPAQKKGLFAACSVAILSVAGLVSHRFWIISKIQATPPWVFYCTAIAIGVYALIYWLVEKRKAHWFNLIKTAGTATLTCYLVPYVAYSLSFLLGIHLPEWLTTGFVGILNCIVFSFLVIGVTYLLGRIHIKLKI
ncbi:MAG: DUF5009 domain-containing protein [Bacteroides sp.]|nr:DUF5009 domain-containing protein [Bacteroides sp.]